MSVGLVSQLLISRLIVYYMHLNGKCNCFCRFHKKIRFDAEYKDSRNGNKYELIYSLRRVLKTPGVETASEFRNTRDILSLLNSWIKSA